MRRPGGAKLESILVAIIVVVLTFVGGSAGLWLKKLLPEQHSVDNSRDMIGAVMGLVTLLLALVLGTIVGSAYFFSSTQQTEIQSLSSNFLQLDKALSEYGPETKPARDGLKAGIMRAHDLFWGGGEVDPKLLSVDTAMADVRPMEAYLRSLDPKTPAQTEAVASAKAHFAQIFGTRLSMSLQLANPVSRPLLVVVVVWSFFLFCGFGLLSKANATTLAALAFGSFAVGSAIFLILELSHPFTGLVRTSPAAVEQTIEAIGK
jgi:hypothetical protein